MSDPLDRFQHHSLITSMFFPQTRLVVAGNPKAAGTSLRWWLLPLHGVDVEQATRRSLWQESAPYQTVWDTRVNLRYAWNNLPEDERRDAVESEDVLTVQPVRNPITRAFSAWSGKYLNAEPYYSERLPASIPVPDEDVESPHHITELFEAFITALAKHVQEHTWAGSDVHFWPQHLMLGRQPAGSVLVLRQESMGEGIAAIQHHLATHGITAGPAPRINETIVAYQPTLVTDTALDALLSLYGEDFTTWNYLPERPEASARDVDLGWLNDVRGRNRRYQVIHEAAMSGEQREKELIAEVARAQTRERELLSSTSWKLTRPVRAISQAVGSRRGRSRSR
ncbi:MAG TPA: sulfotransferase family 2 domain-containing protein [Actinomycetes bacterium]|nr:sulfotransferase family 2 domain-containing protein [Actinomycetes bacterium]